MKLVLKEVCIETSNNIFKCRRTPYNMSNVAIHWMRKYEWSQAWKQEVIGAVAEYINQTKKREVFEQANIVIHLYKVSLFDEDGAYTSIKPILDGLRYAKVIKDDSKKYIDLHVEQHKVGRMRDERVEIEISKREENNAKP